MATSVLPQSESLGAHETQWKGVTRTGRSSDMENPGLNAAYVSPATQILFVFYREAMLQNLQCSSLFVHFSANKLKNTSADVFDEERSKQ